MALTPERLSAIFHHPESIRSFTISDWDEIVRCAKRTGILAKLYVVIKEKGMLSHIPSQVLNHMESAHIVVQNEHRVIQWEVHQLCRALHSIETTLVLLKGAAYVLANLSVAGGRISTDVDILVPQQSLKRVEDALLAHGWKHIKLEDYDQWYYRNWSHELPPLRHTQRDTILDVHHTILPPTGRLRVDSQKLLQASQEVPGKSVKILCPVDMVLHSAAHAFQDGELSRILRDLIDLDELFRSFQSIPGFWEDLMNRAEVLQLTRPLYYGVRYAQKFLQTPLPDLAQRIHDERRPPLLLLTIMDYLTHQAFLAPLSNNPGPFTKLSLWVLYIRSHWLRMPFPLLTKHLWHQTWRHFTAKNTST